MKQRIALILSVLLVAVLLHGCGGGGHSAYSVLDSAAGGDSGSNSGTSEWTILVYLNADNDLEQFGILNVNQMEQVGSSDRVKIVVEMDRSPGYDESNGNWTGAKRFLVTRDANTVDITSPVLQDMGEIDMGDPMVLSDFIRWGQENYPARHYCLVLWNHGSGWRSYSAMAATTVPRNISFDDTSNTSIKTIDLPGALAAASPRLDVVAMDASLMQMVEVAYELRDSASYLVGSEESPPGEGYPYDRWLSDLAANSSMSAPELSSLIVNDYVNEYEGQYAVTQSAIDLSQMGHLAQAVDGFAGTLIPLSTSHAAGLASARDTAQSYAYIYYKDLLDYSSRVSALLGDPAVSAAQQNLQMALSAAVIAERHTGSSVASSHGLSIYIPQPGSYLPRYEELQFARDTRWDEFLSAQTR
jgi:hypothetical protein